MEAAISSPAIEPAPLESTVAQDGDEDERNLGDEIAHWWSIALAT
jgi:hypothetical protein